MLAGMIVTRDRRPMLVRNIQSPAVGFTPAPKGATVYTLQPPDGGALVFLEDPKAEDVPLLPRCVECGPNAAPGRYGAPGWGCRPGCSMGLAQRALAEVQAPR